MLDSVKRKVVGPGDGTPDGVIGCVDLGTYTRILGGSYILDGDFASEPGFVGLRHGRGPHPRQGSGCRWSLPYILSFVGSEYWNMGVLYSLGCKDSLASGKQ